MEKYRKFTDSSTGVNPFTPTAPRPPVSAKGKYGKPIVQCTLGVLLMVLRVLLMAVVLFWILIMGILLPAILSPVAILSQSVRRYTNALGCRALLMLFGFFRIKTGPFPVYENKPNQFAFTPLNPNAGPGGAAPPHKNERKQPARPELIISNHTSYIDVLYFGFRYAPVFCYPLAGGGGEGRVVSCNVLQALYRSSLGLDTDKAEEGEELGTVLARARSNRRPLLLFAEGTTSNGRGVLKFPDGLFDTLSEKQRAETGIELKSVKYTADYHLPNFVVGSPWKHMFGMLTQVYSTMTVKHLRPSAVNALDGADIEDWLKHIRERMATSMGTARAVGKGIDDKWTFLAMWRGTQSLHYGVLNEAGDGKGDKKRS